MKNRWRNWVCKRRAVNLLFEGKDPINYGYTADEEDTAIDEFNRVAAVRGWGVRRGTRPRTKRPTHNGTGGN